MNQESWHRGDLREVEEDLRLSLLENPETSDARLSSRRRAPENDSEWKVIIKSATTKRKEQKLRTRSARDDEVALSPNVKSFAGLLRWTTNEFEAATHRQLNTVAVHGAPPATEDTLPSPPHAFDEVSTKPEDEGSQEEAEGTEKRGQGVVGVFREQPILSAMLLFVPLGFVAYFLAWGSVAVFTLNFLAIIPLAWIMGKATEDLAAHLGQIIGGLLNAWFGNVVEMLLVFAGLRRGQVVVVKCTLIGSILSNLLLVAGTSFFCGGIKHKVQEFSAIGASTSASMMTLSCLCLALPTMYASLLTGSGDDDITDLEISRGISIFLIFIYAQYLIFQLGTHRFLFTDDGDEPEMSAWTSAFLLVACSVTAAFCSDFLIAAIEGVVDALNVSREFIGIILLPIIGNAAEHYTAVLVAMKNKMDLSLACAVGSSCQMALFVTPAAVLAGWAMGQNMSLDLHPFGVVVLILAVLIVSSILQDGFTNWLEGSMLVSAYGVVALFYYFEDPKLSALI